MAARFTCTVASGIVLLVNIIKLEVDLKMGFGSLAGYSRFSKSPANSS